MRIYKKVLESISELKFAHETLLLLLLMQVLLRGKMGTPILMGGEKGKGSVSPKKESTYDHESKRRKSGKSSYLHFPYVHAKPPLPESKRKTPSVGEFFYLKTVQICGKSDGDHKAQDLPPALRAV